MAPPQFDKRCWCWLTCASDSETYTALADKLGVCTTTVFRYVREGVETFVILDGTMLSIDRVGMASGYDRGFC